MLLLSVVCAVDDKSIIAPVQLCDKMLRLARNYNGNIFKQNKH